MSIGQTRKVCQGYIQKALLREFVVSYFINKEDLSWGGLITAIGIDEVLCAEGVEVGIIPIVHPVDTGVVVEYDVLFVKGTQRVDRLTFYYGIVLNNFRYGDYLYSYLV